MQNFKIKVNLNQSQHSPSSKKEIFEDDSQVLGKFSLAERVKKCNTPNPLAMSSGSNILILNQSQKDTKKRLSMKNRKIHTSITSLERTKAASALKENDFKRLFMPKVEDYPQGKRGKVKKSSAKIKGSAKRKGKK
jgi:hypothetical protein